MKSYYSFLNEGGLNCLHYKFIWQNIVPSKVRILSWLLIGNGLLTKERLRNVVSIQYCVFCNLVEELSNHIFLKCPFVSYFWTFLRFRWFHVLYKIGGHFGDLLTLLPVLRSYGILLYLFLYGLFGRR